jgi:hypothetical protein
VIQGRFVISLEDARGHAVEEIGGKARGLLTLYDHGVRIPETRIVLSSALDALLGAETTNSDELRDRCLAAPLPDELVDELKTAVDALGPSHPDADGLIARSSASDEDRPTSRAPGVLASARAAATVDELIRAVREVWASAFSVGAVSYREQHGGGATPPHVAVLIQPYTQGALGGVIYTCDPTTMDPTQCVISWSTAGGAEPVLSGGDAGQTVTLAKSEVASSPELPDPLKGLVQTGLDLDRKCDDALDIEFTVAADGEPLLLQLRSAGYEPPWRDSPDLICDIADERHLRSAKIVALRLSARHIESETRLFAIRPPAFVSYEQAGGAIDATLRKILTPVFEDLLARGAVSVRPAYWSAFNSPDQLPQSGRLLTLDACYDHLTAYWDYLQTNDLLDYSAEPAAICGNWLAVRASAIVLAEPDKTDVVVAAVLGYPEGFEGLPHDRFVVDVERGQVVRTDIARKDRAVLEPRADPQEVPEAAREQPAIMRDLACRLARAAMAMANEAEGRVRAEYLLVDVANGLDPVLWQLDVVAASEAFGTGFVLKPDDWPREDDEDVLAEGTALRIDDVGRLDDLVGNSRGADTIAVLDVSSVDPRERNAAVELAAKLRRLDTPLAIQTSPLSHLAALLRESSTRFWAIASIPDDVATGVRLRVVREGVPRE